MVFDYLQRKFTQSCLFKTTRVQSGGRSMLWKMRLLFWHFDVDIGGVDIGGVDMLVPAELRQSGSLPCLWRYMEGWSWSSLWQSRWGTEKRDGGQPG
jgi:hypothetical protein